MNHKLVMEICRAPNNPCLPGTSKDVYFYGTLVTPAQVNGPDSDVVLSSSLLFSKPRWVPDEDAFICYNCAAKFTAVRRKHHCRQCGRVFCANCCSLKMQLRHLSYQSLERVCVLCRNFVSLIFKAQSSDPVEKFEAIGGFKEICENTRAIIPFIEMGGVIALIFVAKENDIHITNVFLKTVNSLASHVTLRSYLATAGTIKLLIKKLLDADRSQDSLLCDIIGIIRILCSTDSVKLIALQEGTVDALVPYCNANMGPVCLPALECLSVICDHPVIYSAVVNNRQSHTLAKLLILAMSEDEKVQDVTLKILAQISSGSELHRQRLVEEDLYNGSLLAELLTSRSNSPYVIQNVLWLVANLACDENSQGALSEHLVQMCKLLESLTDETASLRHIARGLANFAKFRNNCEILMGSLELVIEKLMQSPDDEIQHHACQIITSLLGFCTSECAQVLQRMGPTYFLEHLGYDRDIISTIQTVLSRKHPMVVCSASQR